MRPTIALRVDWSQRRGLGHLQRCLSLAEALSRHNVRSVLIARREPSAAAPSCTEADVRWLYSVSDSAHELTSAGSADGPNDIGWTQTEDARLSADAIHALEADAVVVDQYELDADWETQVRAGLGLPVAAIDGLADRRHSADLVIDPTYLADDQARWRGLVGTGTRVLRGPRYALISPRFREQLSTMTPRDGTVRRALVSFGGSDPLGLTEVALDAIELLTDLNLTFDIVVGAGHGAPEQVQMRCAQLRNAEFHHATPRIAQLMAAADLALGSGGVTTYERAFLGLPAIVVIAADNQIDQVEEVARAGAVVSLGTAEGVTKCRLAEAIRDAAMNPAAMQRMSRAARAIFNHDTMPGSLRVAQEVLKLLPRRRPD